MEDNMERRKELRFPVSLKIGATATNKRSILGLIKDFSRDGLKAVFDVFESGTESFINIKIQKPNQDVFVPACAEVRWKRPLEGRWEVGFRFKDFVPQVKAEILDYCYHNWLKGLNLSTAYA